MRTSFQVELFYRVLLMALYKFISKEAVVDLQIYFIQTVLIISDKLLDILVPEVQV